MFMTVKAIESPERNEATRWLNYWVIFQFITIFEFVVGFFLSIIPGYYIAKLAFVVWCMAPIKNNGCEVLPNGWTQTLLGFLCCYGICFWRRSRKNPISGRGEQRPERNDPINCRRCRCRSYCRHGYIHRN